MHTRMFFTFPSAEAKTSYEARTVAHDYLVREGFVSEGRFGGGYADWFVIGGRWSGDLTRLHLDTETLKACDAEFGEKYGWWSGGKENITVERRRRQYARVFKKYFPNFHGEIPAWRGEYNYYGAEDDAMLVDETIYNTIKNEHDGSEFFCDMEGEDPSPAFIRTRWAVIVDYHT